MPTRPKPTFDAARKTASRPTPKPTHKPEAATKATAKVTPKATPKAAPERPAPSAGRSSGERQQRAKEAINAALELFNRRWVLRVLWELRAEPMSFRALQSACGDLSPTVLNQRLAELREAALVEAGEAGYALTPLGRGLIAAFEPLTAWALRWQGQRR